MTRDVEDGKSVYEIELVKNNNQYFDIIVDPSVGNISKINDTI
ncbi:MAG: PepSY domain-containing protein [Nitrososphaeraceae archaeon]